MNLWRLMLVLVPLCLLPATPAAGDTTVHDARTLLVDGVYRVGARIDFQLNKTLRNALENGVQLVVELRIEVVHKREWLWPVRVAQLRQRFALEYHALSRRYRVNNFSTGVQSTFLKLEEALAYIGNVYDLPLLDANLLEPDQSYRVRMRTDLDIEALPTPVRVWAYLGSDWSLHSDWHQWPLKP